MEKATDLVQIKNEINTQLADKETFESLLQTTFKGLAASNVKRAVMEGVMRGFTFKDFLEKNIYAIPFKDQYSLVTSVDYARKIGMRSGIVGKNAPVYEMDGKNIVSCSVTVKKLVSGFVGEFTATVFFSEYTTGRNLWITKPRTMIAKVAEMHALRMACPEELSQSYIEEELERENKTKAVVDVDSCKNQLETAKTIEELGKVWSALPVEAKNELKETKDALKDKLTKKPAKKVKTEEDKVIDEAVDEIFGKESKNENTKV